MQQPIESSCPHCARMQELMNQVAILADLYRMKCEALERRMKLPDEPTVFFQKKAA